MTEIPKAPYVTWPEHTILSERMAIQETKLAGIIERFGSQLDTAARNYNETRKELTEHRLAETKNWEKVFTRLDGLQAEIKHPMVPAGQEKAKFERYGWKLIGLMGVVPVGLYYIIMTVRLVIH